MFLLCFLALGPLLGPLGSHPTSSTVTGSPAFNFSESYYSDMPSKNQIGYSAELHAQLAGIKRNWGVFTDPTNSSHVDLIYDVNGSLLRIQVKTINEGRSQINCCRSVTKNGQYKKVPYHATAFDFLIGVNLSSVDFWVIPMPIIKNRFSLGICSDEFKPYRNAWHLIEQEADRRSRAAMAGAAEMDSIAEHYSQPGAM